MGFQPIISKGSPFTFANIPFGVISTAKDLERRCAIAIGEYALDLRQYSKAGYLDSCGEGVQASLSKVC